MRASIVNVKPHRYINASVLRLHPRVIKRHIKDRLHGRQWLKDRVKRSLINYLVGKMYKLLS